jgi:hypothetical protein
MRMTRPLWRDPTLAGLALAAAVSGCSPRAANTEGVNAPGSNPSAAIAPVLPSVTAPLDRAQLIGASEEVASALAAGQAYPQPAQALAGRQFRLVQPFGCLGPAQGDPIRYTLAADGQAMKLTAEPQIWTGAEGMAREGAPAVESVEGFWIRRPWIRQATCPRGAAPAAGSSPETLGLAQLFEIDASRVSRRGKRRYEATVKLRPGQTPQQMGLRLVVEGRLVSRDGGPIRCVAADSETRPVCLILAEFSRVAFEDGSGNVLAEWTG